MHNDLVSTQELPIVESEKSFASSPERQIEKAIKMIDYLVEATGRGKTLKNQYKALIDTKVANHWWFLVGLGLAKKVDEDDTYLYFKVTLPGLSYLRSIGKI